MTEQEKKPDPFAQMLQFYEEWTKTWAAPLSQMVSSKPVADSMAQQMETSLTAAAFMRRQMTELMEQTLQQMNLPSRKEVLSLAERSGEQAAPPAQGSPECPVLADAPGSYVLEK